MQAAEETFGQSIGTKRYGVIYADPPWTFETFSANGHGRSAEAHYDCMTLEAIRALPVSELAEKQAVLLLWARDPMIPAALDLIKAWGFEFKSVGFYWAKLNKSASTRCMSSSDFFTGMGYWTRGNVEQCLLATRGKPVRKSKAVRKLVISPRREHSRKPDEMYDHIENLVAGPYLELFSRADHPGWDSWGAQARLFDAGPADTRRCPSYSKPRQRKPDVRQADHALIDGFDKIWTMPD